MFQASEGRFDQVLPRAQGRPPSPTVSSGPTSFKRARGQPSAPPHTAASLGPGRGHTQPTSRVPSHSGLFCWGWGVVAGPHRSLSLPTHLIHIAAYSQEPARPPPPHCAWRGHRLPEPPYPCPVMLSLRACDTS
uniref:Uncharacterized protein n=1 Tax=Rousettus aegyptiacus TaxID=9407 RepID=A0A7J8H2S4_ROUAE|nr:hypothetical protein HJG63_011421 [Rousettus aegyptiacus]